MILLEDLFALKAIKTNRPATDDEIQAVEKLFERPVPSEMRELWKRSSKIDLPDAQASIYSPLEIYDLLTNPKYCSKFQGGVLRYKLLPLLNDHGSNFVAAAIGEPLSPRILWVPHDDGPEFLYRSMPSYIVNLIDMITRFEEHVLRQNMMEDDDEEECNSATIYYGNKVTYLQHDYHPNAPRTIEDSRDAKSLLERNNDVDDNLAIQLLGPDDIVEWKRTIEKDGQLRSRVLDRLKSISRPAIQELLSEDSRQFQAFSETLLNEVKKAGYSTATIQDRCLGIKLPNKFYPNHYSLDAFFCNRHKPDAICRTTRWIDDKMTGKDPRERDVSIFD